ncbi:Uncharacterised protein [uncultured Roseburia sp.]|uniref:Uncharacterized protein n=1 Tax=Brotonthovivens ammoniilytica TaxID=2981725 RepID=A0ABT2TKM3_9FIRM|nr:hypothetical protein [Brotonthovivens ammoniilytica]MCU6762760.1 hypothetical protein [Brotonthovivens ammoniilytica]SCI87728.1 Uncharacterised protein [uncultured Roseburia sp.]
MVKNQIVRDILEDVLKDGRIHESREIKERCEAAGLRLIDKNQNLVYNVIHHMRKKGYVITSPEKGFYRMENYKQMKQNASENIVVTGTKDKGDQKESDRKAEEVPRVSDAKNKIDWSNFFVLEPARKQQDELRVSVTSKGCINLNSKLQQKVSNNKFEIILSRDCRAMLLNPNGEIMHTFTKAGTATNREILSLLEAKKIKLPAYYIMEWNEELNMWSGILSEDRR